MSNCLLRDTHKRHAPKSTHRVGDCSRVTLKLKARSDAVEVRRLQYSLEARGLRTRFAKQMADQVADLGVAEVVLPCVDNLEDLLKELNALALYVCTVSQTDGRAFKLH